MAARTEGGETTLGGEGWDERAKEMERGTSNAEGCGWCVGAAGSGAGTGGGGSTNAVESCEGDSSVIAVSLTVFKKEASLRVARRSRD